MNVFATNNKISNQEALAKKLWHLHLSLSFQRNSLPKNLNVIIIYSFYSKSFSSFCWLSLLDSLLSNILTSIHILCTGVGPEVLLCFKKKDKRTAKTTEKSLLDISSTGVHQHVNQRITVTCENAVKSCSSSTTTPPSSLSLPFCCFIPLIYSSLRKSWGNLQQFSARHFFPIRNYTINAHVSLSLLHNNQRNGIQCVCVVSRTSSVVMQ